MPSFELVAVVLLVLLAFGDLIVGVVNDAVNFLNSAIGAKVAPLKTIMLIAIIGIIIGATFSDGIIEVARKGIFTPSFFTSKEAIMIFVSVALADIILLDLYSTFGLPTSTTVSIVFELLGAALGLAVWKMGGFVEAWQVINSASAIKIVVGILLSILVAFIAGAVIQFITRLIFTFDYKSRLKKWGFLWCGVALTSLLFFILLKGGSHATFMTPEIKEWIAANTASLLSVFFIAFSLISLILIKLRLNILKIIALIGTASLAMAFAGNDLANFIGVSVAGVNAFLGADLSGTLPTPAWVLILAGVVMSIALFSSKKARSVIDTGINLASHEKFVKNQFKPNTFSVKLCQLITFLFKIVIWPIPKRAKRWIKKRWGKYDDDGNVVHFDLLRAGVNLMVAAAVISFATSQKLPLSTTYVTFMVAMGTALADGAWHKDCAPSRMAGVLTVVGGWFVTAIVAMIAAGAIVSVIYFFEIGGLLAVFLILLAFVYKLSRVHKRRIA